jgi:serine/threonine protein kinase
MGGYAEVFLYEQVNTRMRVAVKVLFKEQLTDRAREQFAAEANTMAELADHPNIVQVFQSDVTADGRPYLVMKFYPQQNLAVRARGERISVPEVLQIGVKIACAVETAHRAGILHRDIKPANILTSQYDEPGLTDFGIATKSGVNPDEDAGGLSIPWSAPEIVFATASGDETADVYSLGATLWHLLVGHSPFEITGGDNTTAALMRRIRETPVPHTRRDDVPGSLERLLAQAMSKRPQDRPKSAFHLARSLQAIESEQRWTPTRLVLLEQMHAGGSEEHVKTEYDDPSEPATRRISLDQIAAQLAIDAPVADHANPAPMRPTQPADREADTRSRIKTPRIDSVPQSVRHRQGIPSIPDELSTVRRLVVSEPNEAHDADEFSKEADGSGTTRWKLLAASAVILIAAIGIAIALGGAGNKPSKALTPVTDAPPTLPVTAPAAPVVTGIPIDTSEVKFSWTVANSQPGDRYYWKMTGGPFHFTSGTTAIVKSTSPPQDVCIAVEVVRGKESNDSQVTCAR